MTGCALEPHVPEQKISVGEAVHCCTMNSAYAGFSEHVKGALTPGKFTDVVMLDKNIFTIDPVEIENARVVLTVVDGKIAFECL
jgi:predicted amidohydrolase YtcJ